MMHGEVNNGANFENVIAQQLISNGFEPYFCKKKNLCELDFVIAMNISDYHIEKAYVFSVGNVEQVGNITYLPIYMSYLLKEKTIDDVMIVDVDISGL